jgi:hypothetical protein
MEALMPKAIAKGRPAFWKGPTLGTLCTTNTGLVGTRDMRDIRLLCMYRGQPRNIWEHTALIVLVMWQGIEECCSKSNKVEKCGNMCVFFQAFDTLQELCHESRGDDNDIHKYSLKSLHQQALNNVSSYLSYISTRNESQCNSHHLPLIWDTMLSTAITDVKKLAWWNSQLCD